MNTRQFVKLISDSARRDLTINAMAMDFDGNLIDPFGGEKDLQNKAVRFVGDAYERMREDYLRILRFFRFHARIAGSAPIDDDAAYAISQVRDGLKKISVERVWMEMSKIISGPNSAATITTMEKMGILDIIGMPTGQLIGLVRATDVGITDPASVLGLYVSTVADVGKIGTAWKLSRQERDRAAFIAREDLLAGSFSRWKELLVDGIEFDWVADLMRLKRTDPKLLADWELPKMPVGGSDLIKAGVPSGPEMGEMIKAMTRRWKDSDYSLTKDELMSDFRKTTVANDQ